MKKTKTELLENIFYKLCVTLQIYLELYNANWIMKFKPHRVQDLISTMALELHKQVSQLIVINFAKSLPDYRIFFSPELHTGRISFITFFVLVILMYFFFLLFYNTLKNSNPEFQNFQ